MTKEKQILLGGTLVLLVFVLVFKSRRSVTPLEAEVVSQGDQQIKIVSPEEQKATPQQVERYRQLVRWEKEERKLDLKRMPLKIVNGEAILNVELVTKGTCFPGDANAIEMELKASPNHRLLATVEELSGKADTLSWKVPENFLKEGSAKHEFKLKVSEEPTQYGFFLCTASSADSRCGDKPVKDINEIFTEHIRKDENAGKETRNIFFQYFMVDSRGISSFSGIPKNDQKFEGLKKYAQERKMKNKAFEKEIDIAKNNMKTLLSFPFQFDGKKLTVELPQYNVAACAGGN
jgi:hypothetical protein